MASSSRRLYEWVGAGALIAALVGAALFLGAADLAMMATCAAVPVLALLLVRRSTPLLDKLRMTSVIALAMPVLLCVTWLVQFPGRVPYFILGAACGLVYMVCFDVIVKLVWTRRGTN